MTRRYGAGHWMDVTGADQRVYPPNYVRPILRALCAAWCLAVVIVGCLLVASVVTAHAATPPAPYCARCVLD